MEHLIVGSLVGPSKVVVVINCRWSINFVVRKVKSGKKIIKNNNLTTISFLGLKKESNLRKMLACIITGISNT